MLIKKIIEHCASVESNRLFPDSNHPQVRNVKANTGGRCILNGPVIHRCGRSPTSPSCSGSQPEIYGSRLNLSNKALSSGGQFWPQSSVGLCVLANSTHNVLISQICSYSYTGVLYFIVGMFNQICRCTFCKYSVLMSCVWFLFQGGPGTRGARGDRGEPGLTVCIMQHLHILSFKIPSIFHLLQVFFEDLR